MNLPHWQRQVTPSGSSGGALMNPNALSGPSEALKVMGDVMSREGAEWAHRLNAIIANNQLGQFQIDAENSYSQMDLGDDTSKFQDNYKATLGKIKAESLSKITHPAARQRAEMWLAQSDVNWSNQVAKTASNIELKKADELANAKFKRGIETGDPAMIFDSVRTQDQNGAYGTPMTPEQWQAFPGRVQTILDGKAKPETLQEFDATEGITRAAAVQHKQDKELAYSDMYAALDAGDDALAESIIKTQIVPTERDTAFSDMDKYKKMNEAKKADNLKVIQNETDAVFYQELNKGTLTPDRVRENSTGEQSTVWQSIIGNSGTSESTIQAKIERLKILSKLKQGDTEYTRSIALKELSQIKGLNRNDTLDSVKKIYSNSEEVVTADKSTKNKIFETTVDRVRNRIERKTDPYALKDFSEILTEIADDAELELRKQFASGDWDTKSLDEAANSIVSKYPTDNQTLRNRQARKELLQIENRDEQKQVLLQKIKDLKSKNDIVGAKGLAEQGLEMGIFSQEELDGKPAKTEEKKKVSAWRRIWDAL